MTRQPHDRALVAAVGGPLDAVLDRTGPDPKWRLTSSMRPFRITLGEQTRPQGDGPQTPSIAAASPLPFAMGQVVRVCWTGPRQTLGHMASTRLRDWWTNRHSLNEPTTVATRLPDNRHR